jgi:hypothetical protein
LLVLLVLALGAAASWQDLRPYALPVMKWVQASFSATLTKQRDQVPAPAMAAAPADATLMLEQALVDASLRLELAERRLAAIEAQLRQTAGLRAKEEVDPPRAVNPPALTGRADTAPESGAMIKAEERAEAKKRPAAERGAKGSLMLLSMRQLREAVDRGTPFETEFNVVQSLGGEWIGDSLALLAPYASTGIPTRAVLVEKFKPIAAAAMSAETQAGGNWLEGRVSQILSSAIVVRKIDAGGGGAGAALKQAERVLAEGDFNGGVDALRSLQGAAAGVVMPWLQAAMTRVNADRALSELTSAAIALAHESGE